MNPTVGRYFDAIEACLIESPVILSYQVLRREIGSSDGKLRIKAVLNDRGSIELFEYVVESREAIELMKYSYHWQDAEGELKCRWDNAPHFLNLPNAPHHVHDQDNPVRAALNVPNAILIVQMIEELMRQGSG